MKKYGIEHFSISLIEECDLSILDQREEYWIKYYDTYNNGYNATLGGDGKLLYDYNVFLEEYKKGSLIIEIAQKYNCCEDTVRKALQLNNIDGKVNKINREKNKVFQYDKNNIFIQSFPSQREAAEYLIKQGIKGKVSSISTNIGRVIKGERKTANGFIWKDK